MKPWGSVALFGAGVYLGMWINNYRWAQATEAMFAVAGDTLLADVVAGLGHPDGCGCGEE